MSPACLLRRTIGLAAAAMGVLSCLDAVRAALYHLSLFTYTPPRVLLALIVLWVAGDALHHWANRKPGRDIRIQKEGIA